MYNFCCNCKWWNGILPAAAAASESTIQLWIKSPSSLRNLDTESTKLHKWHLDHHSRNFLVHENLIQNSSSSSSSSSSQILLLLFFTDSSCSCSSQILLVLVLHNSSCSCLLHNSLVLVLHNSSCSWKIVRFVNVETGFRIGEFSYRRRPWVQALPWFEICARTGRKSRKGFYLGPFPT
jgi:hypothetical protein